MINPTILIVDDDEEDRLILRECFEAEGQDAVAYFSDSLSLLSYLYQHSDQNSLPKLIITDMNMPGMTGIDLLKTLKKLPEFKFIDVVVLSTSDKDEHKLECINGGAKAFFTKPDNYSQLNSLAHTFSQMAMAKTG
jgi:CheY-like chemotaxis protein